MDYKEFLDVMTRANEAGRYVDPLALQKSMTVQKAAYDKEARIGPVNPASADARTTRDGQPREQQDYVSESDGWTQTPEGPVSNHNKIFNDLNGKQFQQLTSDVYDQRVYRDEFGRKYQLTPQGERIPFEGETGFVYEGKALADDNGQDVNKLGFSKWGVHSRYNPGVVSGYKGAQNGWESGPGGIDASQADMNWELPIDVAANYEKIRQGNKYVNQARVSHDDGSEEAMRWRGILGGGTSEYTRQNETPLFNQNVGEGQEGSINGMTAKDFMAQLQNGGSKQSATRTKAANDLSEYSFDNPDYLSNLEDEWGQGRAATNAKLFAAGISQAVSDIADFGTEKVVDLAVNAGIVDKGGKTEKNLRELFDTNEDYWQEKYNINPKYAEQAAVELEGAVADGRYMDAVGSVINNLDIHLSQSLPEMLMLAGKLPRTAMFIGGKVENEIRDFTKETGREPTQQEEAMMWLTNAAAYLPEKFLFIKPLQSIVKGLIKGKPTSEAGKTLQDSLKSIFGGIAVEAAQEPTQQAVENYWRKGGSGDAEGMSAFIEAYDKLKKGEIISKDEAIAASIAGGTMGGALKGAAVAPTAVKNAVNEHQERKITKEEQELGKYTTAEDAEFIKSNLEVDAADNEAKIEENKNAQKALEEANSFEEMKNSSNKTVRDYAKFIEDQIDQKEVVPGSEEHKDHIADFVATEAGSENASPETIQYFKDLGIDPEGKTKEEIRKELDSKDVEFFEEIGNKDADLAIKSAKNRIKQDMLMNRFEHFKKKANEVIDQNLKTGELTSKDAKRRMENFEKGQESRGEEVNAPVDIDTELNAKKSLSLGSVANTLNPLSWGRKVSESLNKYSNESLDNALEQVKNQIKEEKRKPKPGKRLNQLRDLKKDIEYIQNKRSKARKGLGFKDGLGTTPRGLNIKKGDRKGILNAITKSLLADKISDTRDVESLQGYIDSAYEQGFIDDKKKATFEKRLEKISKDHKMPTQEQLDSEQKAEERAAQELKEQGATDKEIENLKKDEISKEDVEAELEEATKGEFVQEILDLQKQMTEVNDKFKKGEIPKDEAVETMNSLKKKEEELKDKAKSAAKRAKNKLLYFTEQERAANNDFGSLESFFKDAVEVEISELTQEQKDILNIC